MYGEKHIASFDVHMYFNKGSPSMHQVAANSWLLTCIELRNVYTIKLILSDDSDVLISQILAK